jgi:hypothetical protein
MDVQIEKRKFVFAAPLQLKFNLFSLSASSCLCQSLNFFFAESGFLHDFSSSFTLNRVQIDCFEWVFAALLHAGFSFI